MASDTQIASQARLQQLDRLAQFLDNAFRIPGTRFRMGLDGLIGLIPGIGDIAGAALSGYLIWQAARLGVPATTLLRMFGNTAVETVVGTIPVVGDIFDIGWKANLRNLTLVRNHVPDSGLQGRSPGQIVRLFSVPIILLVLALIVLTVFILTLLFKLIF